YTGSTKNLEERIKLHNKGNGAKYLRKNQGHPFYLPLLTFIWRQLS
ncbi:MAG: GIY-YIG nuclease family protein, partial [Candidatus Scalinduaceae bacterium]